jgi:glycosyltransferase involved in cell wall biosynthesis
MACGTPTITTAISSMPEFVGDAYLLVPPQDDEAPYQAIRNYYIIKTYSEIYPKENSNKLRN